MASAALSRPRGVPRLRGRTALKHVALASVAIVIAFPFYWMITTAFKSFFEATQFPPTMFPNEFHLENFATAWGDAPWPRFFTNTFIIAIAVTVGELATSILAAYAFARLSFKGKGIVFMILLATYMIPGEATLIPNFVLVTKYLHLGDTLQVQVIPFLASVFSIFLLRQHFLTIPNELADAAKVDGAGHLRFLWTVVLPLSIPVLVTVTLITALGVYDSFQWPLLVTNSDAVRPVQIGMAQFRTEFGAQYHLEMAAATFVIAPVVLIFLFAQRYLIQGVHALEGCDHRGGHGRRNGVQRGCDAGGPEHPGGHRPVRLAGRADALAHPDRRERGGPPGDGRPIQLDQRQGHHGHASVPGELHPALPEEPLGDPGRRAP